MDKILERKPIKIVMGNLSQFIWPFNLSTKNNLAATYCLPYFNSIFELGTPERECYCYYQENVEEFSVYFFVKKRSLYCIIYVIIVSVCITCIYLGLSSRGGLEVELWTDNSLPSASVDQIPLWALNIPHRRSSMICNV